MDSSIPHFKDNFFPLTKYQVLSKRAHGGLNGSDITADER
jgi:hypothetical protein